MSSEDCGTGRNGGWLGDGGGCCEGFVLRLGRVTLVLVQLFGCFELVGWAPGNNPHCLGACVCVHKGCLGGTAGQQAQASIVGPQLEETKKWLVVANIGGPPELCSLTQHLSPIMSPKTPCVLAQRAPRESTACPPTTARNSPRHQKPRACLPSTSLSSQSRPPPAARARWCASAGC